MVKVSFVLVKQAGFGFKEEACLLLSLLELEVGDVLCAISQLDDELATASSPTLLRFPHIRIDLGGWIILQTAVAGGDCLFDGVTWCTALAGDLLDFGIALSED